MLLLLSFFSCWSGEENVVQQAAKFFISKNSVADEGNPILQQAADTQPLLYMKTAKKIVLEALRLDPMITPKNINRVNYTPDFRSSLGGNFIHSDPIYAHIETVWQKGKKEPEIFLFYRARGREVIKGEPPLIHSMYSFDGKFRSAIEDFTTLDIAISPNGKYAARVTARGKLEIKVVDMTKKEAWETLREDSLSKISSNPEFEPVSVAIKWFNNGKKGYCAYGAELYKFSFDSSSDPAKRAYLDVERIGQITSANPQFVDIKNLAVESDTGSSLYRDCCVINYTVNGKEDVFTYSPDARIPDVYTVKTNLGERSLLLSSSDNRNLGSPVQEVLNNVIMGYEVAAARDFKNLESYDAVTVNEKHNAVYLFKNENQAAESASGFIPVIEWANFVPDYIYAPFTDLNNSIMALTRVQVKAIAPDVVKDFVDKKYLLLKNDVKKAEDRTSIDVDSTAKDIVLKALVIYKRAWDKNFLLGSIIPPTQTTIVTQTTAQQTQVTSAAPTAAQPTLAPFQQQRTVTPTAPVVTGPQVGAPQPQGDLFSRLYNRAYTWYASFSDAAKSRMKWFAGVMAAGTGALGLTWLLKSRKGNVPAAYGKIPQMSQPKIQ